MGVVSFLSSRQRYVPSKFHFLNIKEKWPAWATWKAPNYRFCQCNNSEFTSKEQLFRRSSSEMETCRLSFSQIWILRQFKREVEAILNGFVYLCKCIRNWKTFVEWLFYVFTKDQISNGYICKFDCKHTNYENAKTFYYSLAEHFSNNQSQHITTNKSSYFVTNNNSYWQKWFFLPCTWSVILQFCFEKNDQNFN